MHALRSNKSLEIPVGWFLIAALSIAALVSGASSQTVSHVESVGFTVSDMDKAIDFYTRVLPFEKVSDVEAWGTEFEHLSGVFGSRARVVRLKLGDEVLELTEYLTPQGRPIPVDSRSNDLWFQHIAIIVSDMDRAYRQLRGNKVRHASTGPQTLPPYITAAAGIRAFYFRDLDDHVLEILSFPPDKGSAKWRELAKSEKLFLGIDHTAIVVGDTAASLRFYRDALGLTVVSESMNYGTEQEHLNNVFGARLHISGLKTRVAGIAVEFLEYVAPRDGRPYPADSRSNDLWHWQTSFLINSDGSTPGNGNAMSGIAHFLSNRPKYVSAGIVDFESRLLGFRNAAIVRDPDGHAVRLIQQ